jgi:hypothetical protein
LAKKSRHLERIIREAREDKFNSDNMNREDVFSMGRSWKPCVHPPRGKKKVLSEGQNI